MRPHTSGRAGLITAALGLLWLCGCATTQPRLGSPLPEMNAPSLPPGGVWLLYVGQDPVAEVEVPEPSSGNRVDVQFKGQAVQVTLQHRGVARLTPLVHQLEGGLPIVFKEDDQAASPRQQSLRHAVVEGRYRDAQDALDRLPHDEWVELVKALWDDALLELARAPEGLPLVEQLFSGLTSGSPSEAEALQAHRLLASVAQLRSPEEFAQAMDSPRLKHVPYQETGFTVLNSTPLTARWRADGKIEVWLNSRVAHTEYKQEARTLPGLHLLLDADEVVCVTLYDEGGQEVYVPALYLLQLANADDHHFWMKGVEAAGLGLGGGLGTGALMAGGVEATALARVLGWCDGAAMVLGVTTSLLNEHRGWILSRFGEQGRDFLRNADRVNSAAALYGMARVLMVAPALLLKLRTSYLNVLSRNNALEGLTSEEGSRLKSLKGSLDDFFRKVDEVQARRAGGGATATGDASTQAGAKVIPLDSVRKPGRTPGRGAQPVPAQEEPLAATGTGGKLVPIRRQLPGNGSTVAIRKPGPDKGVEPRASVSAPTTPTSASSQPSSAGERPTRKPEARKQAPRFSVLQGGLAARELTGEEYTTLKLLDLEREASRRLSGTTAELNQLRPSRARPPPDVTSDDPFWKKYVAYFDNRLAELDAYDKGRLATRSENPIPWKDFSFFKRNVERGFALENRVVAALESEQALPMEQHDLTKEMQDPRIDRRVGIAKDDYENVLYVDQLVTGKDSLTQKPLAECFSNKSRDFRQLSAEEAATIALKDFKELQMKYSGRIKVRRPGHPLFGQEVDVTRLHLVYDAEVAPVANMKAILKELKGKVEVHFK